MDVDGGAEEAQPEAEADGAQPEAKADDAQPKAVADEAQPEAQVEPVETGTDEAEPEKPADAEPESQVEAEAAPSEAKAEPTDSTDQSPEVKPEVEDQPEAEAPPAEKLTEEPSKADPDSPPESSPETETAKPEPASAFDSLFSEVPEEAKKEESEVKTEGAAGVEPATEADGVAADDHDADDALPAAEGKSADEVFDVEDDGKEIPPKPEAVLDEDYFKSLDREELEWYNEHVQDHNKKLQCTSCFKQVTCQRCCLVFGDLNLRPFQLLPGH